MISNILSGKLTPSYQKKKLVSLEDCYTHLKPYFRLKKSVKNTRTNPISVQEKSKSAKGQNAVNSIEQNQILYAKIMTERLLKV